MNIQTIAIAAIGSVASDKSAIRQSIAMIYINNIIGAHRLAVNSGITCDKIGSIESVLSQMMFFNSPLGIPCTVPSGRRDSLSISKIRTLLISLKVVRWEVFVERV